MRILVTGGRGWIGSHLCPELESRGHEVFAVDRDDGDLADLTIADVLINRYKPDLLVHLAARPGRVFGEDDPFLTVRDNVTATINVARACAEADTRLCYISTSEVYGDYRPPGKWSAITDHHESLKEEHAGLGKMRNLYALTKYLGEQVSQLYAPDDLLIIRPSMPYGPNMATGYGRAALPTMIEHFLHDQTYTVHRDCYRSWCYIDDLVRGMADVIERGKGTYNVGRDDDLRSMEDIAYHVRHILESDLDLILLGDHDSTITPIKDISMARLRSLGWEPKVSIEDGIKMTADALRQVS